MELIRYSQMIHKLRYSRIVLSENNKSNICILDISYNTRLLSLSDFAI